MIEMTDDNPCHPAEVNIGSVKTVPSNEKSTYRQISFSEGVVRKAYIDHGK